MMVNSACRNLIVGLICLMLSGIVYPINASAALVQTGDYLAAADRQSRIERIEAALLEERISRQLAKLGVAPEQARERVAALSDSELRTLDERLQDLPAGAGGVLEVVLVVFLILLILDLTGIANVFPTIGPNTTKSSS